MRKEADSQSRGACMGAPFDGLVPLADGGALPIAACVSSRLADVLLLLDDIQEDLMRAEAADLRWAAPQVSAASGAIHRLLQRFAC